MSSHPLPQEPLTRPLMFRIIRSNQNTKFALTVISSVNRDDFAPKCSYSDRRPTSKLNSRPTLKLQPHVPPRLHQGCIVTIEPNLHGSVCSIRNDHADRITFLQHLTTLIGADLSQETVKGCEKGLIRLPRDLRLHLQ